MLTTSSPSNHGSNDLTDEQTPFLDRDESSYHLNSRNPTGRIISTCSSQLKGPTVTATLYFMSIHFMLAFTEIILVAPLLKLFEHSICEEYYGFDGGGHDCKVVEVQSKLSRVRGVKSGLEGLVVLFTAIPFGMLGDRVGRRRILAISLVGVLASLGGVFVVCAFPQSFSITTIWFSSALLLCGGGLNPASAYMWAMASEAFQPENRSTAFYYIFSAFYIAELIASFTASITTDINPWIPCALAILALLTCLALLAFVRPPTVPRQIYSSRDSASSPRSTIDEEEVREEVTQLILKKSTPQTSLIKILAQKPNILLLLPTFAVGIFRYPTLSTLIQYASVRFNLKISTGAMFYTETALTNIILFLFLVPRATEYLKRIFNISSERIDLEIISTSLLLMSAGALCLGLINTAGFLPLGVFIYSLGFGTRVAALSLITHWIPASSKAAVYAGIVVLESLGHAIGDPTLAFLYSWGLERGGAWQAAPFFFAFVMYKLATVAAAFIKLDGQTGRRELVSRTRID